jgi:hypothetical protein
MNSNGNGTIKIPHFDKWVGQFVDLRNKLKEFDDKVAKTRNANFIDKMNALQAKMLTAFDATGLESARTDHGTASVLVNHYASCSDPDAFIKFVRNNDAYELMDRRANGTACRQFAQETGNLPPGVKINTVRTIGVRKPT